MNKRFKLILNMTMLFVTGLLLVMLSFGWYAVNKQANVNGGTGLTSLDESIKFEETVTANICYLNGNSTKETYKRKSDGKLYLTKRVYKVVEGQAKADETYTESDNVGFFVRSLLPGEYVDITIGYRIEDEYDGVNYSIGFMNVTGGDFTLDGKTHYATGAYKWKSISLRSGSANGNVIDDFTTSTYSWFNTYDISKNDDTNLRFNILAHTWDKDYEKLYYTFRVFEDFTEYYRLVGQSSTYTGDALLSFKTLNIGNIFAML